ncbi:hypothetical protein ET475_05935 [Microbacterium protaetiae]|uniref:Uncharacterized protein n=1 Tax=Microbacterium protaetiae TaxID=2509458 RepID=A0A4P6EEQ1_9MICO|nr:hypothetical protein [Microbacterium protaetiae]QAY59569.1 hypothetical protein ET475_05935 [Microbacterium protaetiae]
MSDERPPSLEPSAESPAQHFPPVPPMPPVPPRPPLPGAPGAGGAAPHGSAALGAPRAGSDANARLASAELRALVAPSGWKVTALLCATVVGTALVMAIISYLAVGIRLGGGSIEITSPLGWIAVLWATILGGGVAGRAEGSLFGGFTASATAELSIVAVGAFVVIIVLAVAITRLAERGGRTRPRWVLVMRSVLEALMVAVVVTVLAAFIRVGAGGSGTILEASFTVSAHPFRIFALTFLVVAGSTFFARLRRAPHSRAWGAFTVAAREAGWYAAIPLALLTAGALVGFIVAAIHAEAPEAFLLWVPLGLNAAALAFGAAQFGGVRLTGFPTLERSYHLWDLVGGWSALIIVATMLVLLYLTVFLGTRRARTGRFTAGRVWQLPVIVLIGSTIASFVLLSIRLSGSAFGSTAAAQLMPSWETPFLLALFALAVSLGAEGAPAVVYAVSPTLLGRLAGRRAAAAWVAGAPRRA